MKKPGKYTIPTKYILTFLSVLCAGFVLLTVINSDIARPIREFAAKIILPVQDGMNHVGGWFSDKADDLKELRDLQKENDKLKAEVIGLLRYNSFKDLFEDFDISILADASMTKEELLSVLSEFYTPEKQAEYGVIGIRLKML